MHGEKKEKTAVTTPALIADMLRQSLEQGDTPFLTISSDSMAPLLKTGDQVGLEPVEPFQLNPGDIITLAPEGDLLTHRFWGMGNGCLRTRGDRPLVFDPLWTSDCLLGRVIVRKRNGRSLSFTSGWGQRLNRHLAWLIKLENKLYQHNWLIRILHRGNFIWAILITKTIQ